MSTLLQHAAFLGKTATLTTSDGWEVVVTITDVKVAYGTTKYLVRQTHTGFHKWVNANSLTIQP